MANLGSFCGVLACLLVSLTVAQAQVSAPVKCNTTLMAHSLFLAATYRQPPSNAPDWFNLAGRFTGAFALRSDEPYSINLGAPLKFPSPGQPVQGLLGIKTLRGANGTANGTYMTMVDNGFGSKKNSPDALLTYLTIMPNWATHDTKIGKVVTPSDPDKLVPFQIVNENTDERYLTGADFDLEAFQLIGDQIYFGNEFGPYMLACDRITGKKFIEPTVNGSRLASPDNHYITTQNPGTPSQTYNGALYVNGAAEVDSSGARFLRMLRYNITTGKFIEPSFKYTLANNSNSIGDFNMINNRFGLIIERDDGQGDPRAACTTGVTPCWKTPALFKRVYLIDLASAEATGFVTKVAYIDLLDIKDPNKVGVVGTVNGVFTFPFVTIEDVDWVNSTTIIVGNDINYPSSIGRTFGQSDDNEQILLDASCLMKLVSTPIPSA